MEKIALVTGSSRGIGRAVARRLAAEGYAVCVNYRERQDCAMSLVAEISAAGGRAMAVQADVAHRVQVNEMVRRVEGELGPVSLLVNNAGVAGQALFQDITDALWRRYFAVNVDGAFHTIQAVLPHMLHEHAGCIVNVSSIWGLRGASCEVTYSATKGALIALTRSLASELAVRIQGDSMAPVIADGSVVYVNHDPVQSGDVGIFCVDGDMLCKQYYRDPLGMVYLFSLNRKRADMDVIFHRGSGRSLTCFGRVMLHAQPLPEGHI